VCLGRVDEGRVVRSSGGVGVRCGFLVLWCGCVVGFLRNSFPLTTEKKD